MGDREANGEDEALRRWVESLFGGRAVEAWRCLLSGNSRTSWAADVGQGPEAVAVVVRVDSGAGPFSGTPLTLEREAVAYRALQGRGIRIPRLYGYHPELNAMVLERAAGEDSWDDQVRDAVLDELAALHALDAAALELPGFGRSAAAEVELWARIARERIAPADPLVDFAVSTLLEAFPGEPDRHVMLHGDIGPGNLLWDGEKITALLDWEMSHVGDPHDDLAYLAVRTVLHGRECGDLGRSLRARYARRAGLRLEEPRLRYWQAVAVLRNLISCMASIANGRVAGRDKLVHYVLLPPLGRLMVRTLAAVLDVEVGRVDPPVAPVGLPGEGELRAVADGVEALLGAVSSDSTTLQRARRTRYLVSQLAETWPLAFAIAEAERDQAPATDPAERLRQLSAAADRRLALFPRGSGIAEAVLPGLG